MSGETLDAVAAAFKGLARGDMQGLDVIWRELSRPLHNYAFALTGSHDDADDILGDCLVRLAKRGWRLRLVRDPKSYLFTAVRNAARDRGRRSRYVPDAETLAPVADHAEAVAIRQAVLALPVDQREAVALHIWGGLTFNEIGRTLGVSQNTAASRYRYAIKKLRDVLGDEFDETRRPREQAEVNAAE